VLQSILSALKSTIRFIQLKLTDFENEPPNVDNVLTEQFIKRDQPLVSRMSWFSSQISISSFSTLFVPPVAKIE
jgi:hypothetical protein